LGRVVPERDVKAAAEVAGMLADADSIDDLGVLRHGAMGKVFTGLPDLTEREGTQEIPNVDAAR